MPGGALEGEEQRITSSSSSKGGRSSTSSASGITSYFVGRKLDEHRGAFLLDYPMERGRVVDGGWDAMELLWEVSLAVEKRRSVCFIITYHTIAKILCNCF